MQSKINTNGGVDDDNDTETLAKNPSKEEDLPTVMLICPTGSIKEYALLYMLASIKNVDYPPDKLHLCFAITDREDRYSIGFMDRAKTLIANCNFQNEVTVLFTKSNIEEFKRWSQYYAVIKNLHEARKIFLDGDWDYWWLLGGDNPPHRATLKKLLACEADVANAIINQRPLRGFGVFEQHPKAVYPVFWHYGFTPKEVRSRKDLDPRNRSAIIKAWTNLCYFELVKSDRDQKFRDVCCGSGCQLVKRQVLEYAGYYLSGGYHSEDIAFGQHANLYDFDYMIDTGVHCAHFDKNGLIY